MASLKDFPAPLENSAHWPWVPAQLSFPQDLTGTQLPRITVITPSFNQGHFIEETIRSVLLQGYPGLEYIVIDGGSTDETISIIKKYEPWLSYWVSEPDRGQSHAINKGLEKATGDLAAWLNADDVYLPDALFAVARAALKDREHVSWIVGTTLYTDSDLSEVDRFVPEMYSATGRDKHYQPAGWLDYVCNKRAGISLPQQSSFWRRSAVVEVGGIEESLHYAMDHELYGRLAHRGYRPVVLDKALACFRTHGAQKTSKFPIVFWQEELAVVHHWVGLTNGIERQTLEKYAVWLDRKIRGYPLQSFYQTIFSYIKKQLKFLFPSVYKNLRDVRDSLQR